MTACHRWLPLFVLAISFTITTFTVLADSPLPTTPATPLYCPLPVTQRTLTLFLDPCLMSLNRLLASASLSGQDLPGAVPQATAYFPSHAPHLNSQKWTTVLNHLVLSMKNKIASTTIYTVTVKTSAAPGTNGDLHNYYSLAPYYWPDPSKPDGLPYIEKDGQVNPEIYSISDQEQFNSLADDVYDLSVAFYLLNDERYAARAIQLLRAWYITPATYMYPQVEHGQVRKGWQDDRGQPTGIIELVKHVQIIDSLNLLNSSTTFIKDTALTTGLRSWFTTYLTWLQNSTLASEEHTSSNNHHTWFNVQAAFISAYLGDFTSAVGYLNEVPSLLQSQFNTDGSQPFELTRTNSWHYSNFNLQAMSVLARLSQSLKDNQMVSSPDLIGYTPDSDPTSKRNILGGLNYMMPYLPQTAGLTWSDAHLQNFAQVLNDIVPIQRTFVAIYTSRNYTQPSWSKAMYTYAYQNISEDISPFYSDQIAWVLSGPNINVPDSPPPSAAPITYDTSLITIVITCFIVTINMLLTN